MIFMILLFYVVVGILICNYSSCKEDRKPLTFVWLICFLLASLYSYIAQLYVDNPTADFFINPDQVTFFNYAYDLHRFDSLQIISEVFSEFIYHESPLSFTYYAYLIKISEFIGFDNPYLFILINTSFLGSLILILLYCLSKELDIDISKKTYKWLFLFFILTPVFEYSCQMVRDIHVCLLTTLGFLFVFKKQSSFRLFWLLFTCLLAYGFRLESGMFLMIIVGICFYRYVDESSNSFLKFASICILVVGLLYFGNNILIQAIDTTSRYNENSLGAASSTSFGAQLFALPKPLNYIAVTLFGQMLPFPILLPFSQLEVDYYWLRTIEVFWSFFWFPIFIYVNYIVIKKYKELSRTMLICFSISLVMLIAMSYGEFNPRRMMVIYPWFFVIFLKLYNEVEFKRFQKLAWLFLVFANIVYYILKM